MVGLAHTGVSYEIKEFKLGFLYRGAVFGPAVGHGQIADKCIPDCRTGYLCQTGNVSRCNPACPSGSECTDAGECAAINALPATVQGVHICHHGWVCSGRGNLFRPAR